MIAHLLGILAAAGVVTVILVFCGAMVSITISTAMTALRKQKIERDALHPREPGAPR